MTRPRHKKTAQSDKVVRILSHKDAGGPGFFGPFIDRLHYENWLNLIRGIVITSLVIFVIAVLHTIVS